MARTRRLTRYQILRNKGLTNFEASIISTIPLNVPFIKDLILDREYDKAQAIRNGMSEGEFVSMIKQQYIMNGFFKPAIAGRKAKLDVWAMIRDYEKKFKDKHPSYTSPWMKRRRNWVLARDKMERTIAAQGGMLID